MGGLFGDSDVGTPEIVYEEAKPTVVDTSDKVREEEARKRKRKGVSSQVLAGNTAGSGKTQLGQ